MRSIREPTQRKRRALAVPAELAAGFVRRPRRERLEVDAEVGDLDLRPRFRDPVGQLTGEPAGVGDHRGGAAEDPAGRRGHSADPSQVGDVLAVGHDDERGAGGASRQRARGAGREEEVGEDDVGPEALRGRRGPRGPESAYSVGEPPRRLIEATSTSWPSASSSRVSGTRKLPRSGCSGLGHIWVTSRILTLSATLAAGCRPPRPRGCPRRRPGSSAWRACSQ